jgi:hypothetical protein
MTWIEEFSHMEAKAFSPGSLLHVVSHLPVLHVCMFDHNKEEGAA